MEKKVPSSTPLNEPRKTLKPKAITDFAFGITTRNVVVSITSSFFFAKTGVVINNIEPGWQGLDIGEETIKLYSDAVKDAKTVVWNGPAGVFEVEKFAVGTKSICETLANLEGATTIIGGGDSAAAAISMGYESKFSHISTGGGASLEYLEGKTLPGVACLSEK